MTHLELEAEAVATLFDLSHLGEKLRFPVESLGHIRLDVQLVQTLASLLGTDLLNGSQERVGLVKSVQEADCLVDESGLILPQIQLVETLLQVVHPRAEGSCSLPGLLGPLSRDSVQLDGLHQLLHIPGHGQLS